MMARTPIRMACHSLLFPLSAAMLVAAATLPAHADPTPATASQASSQETVDTAGTASQTEPEQSAQATHNRPSYQNPFDESAKAPPIEGTAQSGSASQWRRPTIPRWVAPGSEPQVEPSPHQSSPPPIAAVPSLITDLTKSEPLIHTTPKTVSRLNRPPLAQPDSIKNGPPVTVTAISSSPTTLPAADGSKPDVATAAIVANAADVPEDCLTLAQDAAAHATSVEALTNVIELSEQGLRGNPSAKMLASLRRLAAWGHNRRGELLADAQRLDDALRDFQAAIAIDPTCSLAIHNRGVSFAQRNQFAAALRDFNRVIELNPGLAVAYRNRAELLSALDRMQDAVADYDRAITALPTDAELRLARAHAHQRLGNFAQASTDIKEALTLKPNDAGALIQRGNLAADQGMFADAEKDFHRAIASNPNSSEAHRCLAWLQATCPDMRCRNAKQALAAADRAAELAPDDYQVLDTLAAAEACAGNFDRAIELQQKALASVPGDQSNLFQERLTLYQQHRPYATPAPRRDVQPASHETLVTPVATRPSAVPPKTSGIVR